MLENLVDHLLYSYLFALAVFLLLRLFNKEARNRSEEFLNAANKGLLFLLGLNMLAIFYLEKRSFLAVLLLNFVLAFAFHLLFLWRKFRVRIWLTILLGTMLACLLIYEYALVYAVEQLGSRSSWAFYYSGPAEWAVVSFGIVYYFVCWILSGRKISVIS